MNSHLLILKVDITKSRMVLSSAEIFEVSLTNSVDPHCLSTMFASILTDIFGRSYIAGVLRVI